MTPRQYSFPMLLCLLVVALSGCASLVTTKAFESRPSGKDKDGIVYYLPKTLVKLVLTRNAVPSDRVKTTAAAAEAAKTKAKEAKVVAAAANEAATTAEKVATTSVGGPADLEAKKKADLLRRTATVAQKAADEAETKAKEAEAVADAATASAGAMEYEDGVTLSEVSGVPDTARIYVARLRHWVTHADKLKITTTGTGLLKTTVGETEDKSAAILEDAAKVALQAVKAATTFREITKSRIVPSEWTCEQALNVKPIGPGIRNRAFTLERVFDPTMPQEVDETNRELCKVASPFLIVVDSTGLTLNDGHLGHAETAKGLVYRRPIPYTIQVRLQDRKENCEKETGSSLDECKKRDNDRENNIKVNVQTEELKCKKPKELKELKEKELKKIEEEIEACLKRAKLLGSTVAGKTLPLQLPNKGPVAVVPMDTGWFTTTTYDLGFEDGMLTKMDVVRPSEVHGALQVPLTVIKDIVSLPTDLLQLKIDYSTKDTALFQQQKANIEAQEALRKALEDLKKSSAPITPTATP